ncbi:PEBP-like protein [Tothia fuscella]|uniref:PEBP-like protein n=1 Tax=Tothia fuscella TaxID=1048955 RepID=A0A9P4NXQ4_9PEZI|nr:PEBP-like protein [Tothia fuscella]
MALESPLTKSGVIPDVLKSAPSPDLNLRVSYENETLKMGANIARQETTMETPTLTINAAGGNDRFNHFTIIMTDPDLFVKNDPTGQVRHWLQTGLTRQSDGSLAATTPAVTPYLPCAPGPGPAHRYVFILCDEGTRQDVAKKAREEFPSKSDTHDLKDRMGFNAQEFIDKYGLTIVGVTFMEVSPTARSLVDNLQLGAQSLYHKVVGT